MSISAAQQGKYGGRDGRSGLLGLVALACLVQTGCLMDRDIDAIPVARVPEEVLIVDRKDNYQDISLLRLRQDPPETYLLGPGDVLGVYIKGVLGSEEELPPIHFPEDGNRPPAVGLPVPVVSASHRRRSSFVSFPAAVKLLSRLI